MAGACAQPVVATHLEVNTLWGPRPASRMAGSRTWLQVIQLRGLQPGTGALGVRDHMVAKALGSRRLPPPVEFGA